MDVFLIILAIMAAFPSYLKKGILKDLNRDEYWIIAGIVGFVVSILMYIKAKYIDKKPVDLGKVNNKHIFILILVGVIIRYFIGYQKLNYLKKSDVSKFYPVFKSLTIAASFLIGVWFLKEKKSLAEWIGISMMVAGVFIMKSGKKDK